MLKSFMLHYATKQCYCDHTSKYSFKCYLQYVQYLAIIYLPFCSLALSSDAPLYCISKLEVLIIAKAEVAMYSKGNGSLVQALDAKIFG